MSSLPKTLAETDDDEFYPSSDGEPVGETDWHIWALILLREGLEDHFAERQDVYVASDLFLYYVKGDRNASKAPDAMVVKGVAKHFRRSFRTWVEKAMPCVIIELASGKTWQEDLGPKRALYARLGVAEYFVFDPEAAYLNPALQGFRLKGKKYVPLVAAVDESLTSKELGLRLLAEDHMLRLIDARTGQPILTRQERAEQEKQRADALEAELKRLRAAQAKSKGKKR